jgi:hypothetical protein
MTTRVARVRARARPRKSRMVSFMSELVNRIPSGGIDRMSRRRDDDCSMGQSRQRIFFTGSGTGERKARKQGLGQRIFFLRLQG